MYWKNDHRHPREERAVVATSHETNPRPELLFFTTGLRIDQLTEPLAPREV